MKLHNFSLSWHQGLCCRWEVKTKLDHVFSLAQQGQYLRVEVHNPLAGVFVSNEQRRTNVRLDNIDLQLKMQNENT